VDEIFEIHDHWLETAFNIASELIECGVPFPEVKGDY
jgi:hypothetical protein